MVEQKARAEKAEAMVKEHCDNAFAFSAQLTQLESELCKSAARERERIAKHFAEMRYVDGNESGHIVAGMIRAMDEEDSKRKP